MSSGFGHGETVEKKTDGAQHHITPTLNPRFAGILQQPNIQHLHSSDVIKAAMPAGIKQISSRPIIPAPGLPAATAINVTTAKLMGTSQGLMNKTTALGSSLEAMSLQQTSVTGGQTVPVNLSTQGVSSLTSNSGLHLTMSTQSLHSLNIQNTNFSQAGTLSQSQQFAHMANPEDLLNKIRQDKDKSRITVMAPAKTTEHDRSRANLPMASLIGSRQVPSGHPQASAHVNLTLTPGVQSHSQTLTQTPIITALPQSHIPRGAAAASALAQKTSSLANPIRQPISSIQSPMISHRTPLRPTLIPAHPPTSIASQSSDIQRASAHIMTSLDVSSSVQISGLQGRPVLSHIQTKGTISTQPLLQQPFTQQKVIMTQPQLISGNTAATLVTGTAPKLTGQNLALNLGHPTSGTPRGQKIMTTQVQGMPQGSIMGSLGGQALSLPRAQKLLVSQSNLPQSLPTGAVLVNSANKPGMVGKSLAQRPQKVVMSHVAVSSVPVSMATMPKPSIQSTTITAHALTMPTMASTTTMTTQPISQKVKVQAPRPPQSHIALTTNQTVSVEHREVLKQGTIRPTQPITSLSQTGITAPGQHPSALCGLPRPMNANATTLSNNVMDGKPANNDRSVRPAFQPPHLQIPLPPEYCNMSTLHYPLNVVYQAAPFPQGSTLRPSIVPGQPTNLAATLQTAPQAVVSTTTGVVNTGVRINPPVMVNVDPSHANAIAMATQFAGTHVAPGQHLVTVTQGGAALQSVNHPASPMSHGLVPANQQQGTGSQPTNASPRPSILRKRSHDTGNNVMMVKRKLSMQIVNAVDSPNQSEHPMVSPKHSIDPNRENSQSSTDTASSTESTPQSCSDHKIKLEPPDNGEQDATSGLMLFGQIANNNIEASPRKKPRKQLLEANHELQDDCSSDEELDKLAEEDIKKEIEWMEEDRKREEEEKAALADDVEELVDEEGVRWTREKNRPPISLLNHYACTWKSRNNHFNRYNDVKSKEERRPTVNELANQKGIHQKASGWKMYHLAAQLEELMDLERDVFSSMSVVQESIAPKHIAKNPTMEDDISMVHELTQGNIQRSQLVMDQLEEARVSMVKVLEHKKRINEVINKHHSKRPVKKKERT